MMHDKHFEGLSGGIFLIGLGLLFLVPGIGFWPWILVVIGAASLPASLAANKGWVGWQSFFWMCGLAVLFGTGYFWPGILILIGLSSLLGALTKDSQGNPFAGAKTDQATETFAFDDVPPSATFANDSDHTTKKLEE